MPDISSLNKEQQQAVTFGKGPLMIIAGAGTGKTTVVTKRIEHLILEKNVSPSNILALTFTDKAATEMESRVDEIMPYGYTTLWIETFHAFCDRILRQEAISIGLNPRFQLMSEAEALLFARKHLFEFKLNYYRPISNPTKFLQGMLTHFSRLKDDDITPEQYLDYAERKEMEREEEPDELLKIRELAEAFKTYEDLKAKEGVMDYSDLISNVLKLFRMRPSVLKQYQKQFEYVFVDEFQDTNYAQNEMAILLAGERKNITVVGDDDQSIYRWRGAAISNMLQFKTHFPTAEIITLTKNYRSSQTILDGAYRVIQYNNPDRLEVKENINKELQGMKGLAGEPIQFVYANRGEDEAEEVAKIIKADVKKHGRSYNDYAILVRANDHATPFQRSLERLNIPVQFLGPGRLFQQPEIKDLIAYLHVLADFDDSSSLYRVLTMPIFEVAARDVASLLNHAKRNNIPLFEAMERVENAPLTEEGREKVTHITDMIKTHLEKIPNETAGQIMFYFFEDSGLLQHYLDPDTATTEKEAQNIAKFFDKLQAFAANKTDASVFAAVDWLDLAMELGESPQAAEIDWSRNNAVNILTVHSSKGLEFPVVFVVNLVSQRFPGNNRSEQIPLPQDIIRETLPEGEEHIQEERRLFYVAVTRAQEQLYLTGARYYNEGKRAKKISPFVAETIGEQLVERTVEKTDKENDAEQLSLLEVLNSNAKKEEAKSVEPLEETDISYVSYSQLQMFQMCPLHYKLRYILNLPSAPTPALSYGVSVHSALRDFFLKRQQGEDVSPKLMHDLLEINWVNQGYSSKSHEKQTFDQAEAMLEDFAEKTIAKPPETIAIETPFSFWLERLKVGGRIDRVDRLPDGKIEIIDYKTGKNVPTQRKADADLQLTLYALAASEVHDEILRNEPDNLILTLHYLEDDVKISTVRSKEQLEEAKKTILNLVQEMRTSDFTCSKNLLCKSCEFVMLCQAQKT